MKDALPPGSPPLSPPFGDMQAARIAAMVRTGEVAANCFAHAARAHAYAAEPELQAWAFLEAPHATGPSSGPAATPAGLLAGVPVGIKDIIDVAGMPTGCGSALHAQAAPARFDAACVAQLRDAGAVPIGKTVTAEFAFARPGPTRNPWNTRHTPGGSSSGSAAAVAAGSVPLALGTQTGGSIIRPAAYCGVVGFKPTASQCSHAGIKVLSASLDTLGWFARSVADATLAAHVLLPAAASQKRPLPEWRVAVLPCQGLGALAAPALAQLEASARRLADAGAAVEVFEAPAQAATLAQLTHLHGVVMRYEMARSLLPEWRDSPDGFSPVLAELMRDGLRIAGAQYRDARAAVAPLGAELRQQLGHADLILTPSAAAEAPFGLDSTGQSSFNRIWTLLGWPALHLPTGFSSNKLPLGVQLVGQPGHDFDLLEAAHTLQTLADSMPAMRRSNQPTRTAKMY